MKHLLTDVVEFTSRTVRFEKGLPVREPVTPYWRWYCSCGTVGGKRTSEENAVLDHQRHRHESDIEGE